MWGNIIGAGMDLLGGVMDVSAAKRANKWNVALQREQQAWEERMSNTAWVRGTQDMLKAGINPMLAISQGPASTPNVSAATVSPETGIGRGLSSAAGRLMQTEQIKGQALVNENQELTNRRDRIDTINKEREYGVEIEGQDSAFQRDQNKKYAESRKAVTDADIRDIEKKVAEEISGFQVQSAAAQAKILTKEVDIKEAQNMLMRLDIPEKEAMANWFNTVGAASPAAKAVMSIGQWLKMIFNR